jgi:flagellar basal-body rod protein FlgB
MTVKPSQFDALHRIVTLTDLRHEVISQNLANVNTPGYKRLDVSFEDIAASFSSPRGQRDGSASVCEDEGLPVRADENSVDIDKEIAQLGKNEMLQQTIVHVLAKKLGMMQSAITGR